MPVGEDFVILILFRNEIDSTQFFRKSDCSFPLNKIFEFPLQRLPKLPPKGIVNQEIAGAVHHHHEIGKVDQVSIDHIQRQFQEVHR